MLSALALGLLVGGCSAPAVPLCNQAGVLLAQGRVADSMALYARASAQDEGACAEDGLRRGGERIAEAAEQEAAGAAAELAGDNAAAIAAYQEALRLNNGDARAAASLARLGQPVPIPLPVEIPQVPVAAEPAGWWRSPWPLVVGAVLLALALAVAGYALFGSDRLRRRMVNLESAATTPMAQPAPDQDAIAELRQVHEMAADVLANRCTALEEGLAQLTTSGARRDRLLELLAGQLTGPAAGGVQREQLFAAPARPAAASGEGSGVIDVTLVGAEMADGSRRTVVQRVRWTPPDDAAAAALADQVGSDPITTAAVLATGTVTPAWAHSTELWLLPAATGLTADVGSDGALATLVGGGAVRSGELTELTADVAGTFAADGRLSFLARLVTVVVRGAWTRASLSSEAHDAASGVAAAALEAAAGLTGPVWAGTTGRTPGPPAELTRLLGRPALRPEERPASPVLVHVVADPLDEDGEPVAGPHGAWRIERFAVDVEGVLRALDRTAAEVAGDLAERPSDPAALDAFRGALRAAPAPGAAGVAVASGVLTTVGCDVLAVGDRHHHVQFAHRVATTRLDLAGMLADSPELTRAFAEQLHAVRTGGDGRAFDAALREAAGPEQLGPTVATLPGRTLVLTAGPESVGAVESTYTATGAAAPETEPTRQGSQMYDALRKRSGAHAAPPSGAHAAPPSGAHAAPPSGAHAAPPAGAHAAPPSGAHAAPPSGAHAPPPSGAHAPPPSGAHAPPPSGAHALPAALTQPEAPPAEDSDRQYRAAGRGYDEPAHQYVDPDRAYEDAGPTPNGTSRDYDGSGGTRGE